ncbi:hypothetical protein [Marinobacter sp. V034]|uniref:hypothetical protein n=1 Tax=Marinobacter sp. V034 TaxID=3459610 RepID=UPI0040444B09
MRPTPHRHALKYPKALASTRARNDLFDLYNRCGIDDTPAPATRQMHLNQLLNWGFRVNAVAPDHWVLTPPGSSSLLHLYGEQELARYTGHRQWQRSQHQAKPSVLKDNHCNVKEPT